MGDPRRLGKKFSRPGHPWQAARIEEERKLVNEYGLANKSELWKVHSSIKSFTRQAKSLFAVRSEQGARETKQLLDRVARLGLLPAGSTLDDVLGLTTRSLLDRRLQTFVFSRGMAHTPKQARQFIVHGHVMVNNRKVSSPGYLVPVSEEGMISFIEKSSLFSPDHPERGKAKPAEVKSESKPVAKPEGKPKQEVKAESKPAAKSEGKPAHKAESKK